MQELLIEDFTLADLLQPETLANPYPTFRKLRQAAPVCYDTKGLGWIVSRYDDVSFVLSDRRFSAERIASRAVASYQMSPVEAALSRQMLFLDPPDHTRLRSFFTKAFTPRRMESLRPEVQLITKTLLDEAEQRIDAFDFIHEVAVPLPVIVIAQMLGVPTSDRDQLRAWSVAFGKLINGRSLSADESKEAQQGVLAFIGYFRALIEDRRKKPANDMLTDLIAVEELGDHLSTEELIVNLILLLAAGHGTTTHLLGNGLLALLQHPEEWRSLIADPTIAPSAVTELLRFDGPVQATTRESLEEVQVGATIIPCGEKVTVLLGSANRDEAHFPEPDTLNLRRSGPRLLSFGHGIHTCLGAALARMEAQIAFTELALRFPSCRLIFLPERTQSVNFRGLQRLMIQL